MRLAALAPRRSGALPPRCLALAAAGLGRRGAALALRRRLGGRSVGFDRERSCGERDGADLLAQGAEPGGAGGGRAGKRRGKEGDIYDHYMIGR